MKRLTAAAVTLTLVLALVGCSFAAAANAPTTTTATWSDESRAVEDTTITPTSTSKSIKSANFDTSAVPSTVPTTTTTTPKPLIVNGTFDVREYVLSLLPEAKATFLPDCGELKQLQIVVDLPRGKTKILVLGAVEPGDQVSPSVHIRFPEEGVSYNLTPSSADTATVHGRTDRGDFFISEEVVEALSEVVPDLAGSTVGEDPFEGTGIEHAVDNTVSDYAPMVS